MLIVFTMSMYVYILGEQSPKDCKLCPIYIQLVWFHRQSVNNFGSNWMKPAKKTGIELGKICDETIYNVNWDVSIWDVTSSKSG